MTIELNEYGLMIDLGDFFYVSLSWAFIIVTSALFVAYKVYKVRRDKWQFYYVPWQVLVWRISQLTNGVSP